MTTARERQRAYYASTAETYAHRHVFDNDEHGNALRHISLYVHSGSLGTVLDVGCGTGRAGSYLSENHPDLTYVGVDPVPALLKHAPPNPQTSFVCAEGEQLPFAKGTFDAVCSFGVLHHVQDPRPVVAEMMRVAKRFIFLSDSNRFGQGSRLARYAKVILYKTGLWPIANTLKTRGRGYSVSEGDGISYSYSVYDSLRQLGEWADQLILVPTDKSVTVGLSYPLMTAAHVLVCAHRRSN